MKGKVEKLFLSKKDTIQEAMEKLNDMGCRNLYVVDEDRKLLGSISDGDIRRGILNGVELEETISTIMSRKTKYVYMLDPEKNKKIKELLLNVDIETIPILNNDNIIIDIVFLKDILKNNNKRNCKTKSNFVFLLAGGLGTRLEPFTKILPKPLIPIGDTPIIEKIMDKFCKYGFENFVLSLNYKADMIKLYFNDCEVQKKYSKINYIKEDNPLGTIGSLYLAKDLINDSFFITNSDILIEEDMEKIFEYHKENKAILTIVGCVKNSVIPYGVLNTDDRGFLTNIKEKPEYKHIINTGVYVAEPEIIDYIKNNEKKDMNELIEELLQAGKKVNVYPIFEEMWFDVGQWIEYERTVKYFEKI